MIEAGRAQVPFVGDFSQLESGALASITKIGFFSGGITKGVVEGAAALVTSVVGTVALAIDLNAKFSTSLSAISARTGQTSVQVHAIGDAWLSTAGKSTFSALQMSDAFAPVSGQLAMIEGHALGAGEGLSFMDSAGTLAEATGQALGSTTASLAQVMQAYGLKVEYVGKVSDILFNVSTSLNIPIADLATTVDKLHAKLGPLAPSLSDVGTLLEDVATHGLTGNRALLLVSTGLNTLLGGSKTTGAELKALKLTIYDASGGFVGMQSVIAQLAPKLSVMTEQQRLFAEKELFGAGASKALDATIMAGLPGWDLAAAKVTATGTAHAGAIAATNNLGGSFDRLKAKVVDWLTQAGGPFQTTLTGVTDWITNTGLPDLGHLGQWFVDHQKPIEIVAASLAGLYVARKGIAIGGSVIGDLERFFGSGNLISTALKGILGIGGGGGGVASKLAPQDVFVTNWAMLGGGGVVSSVVPGAAGAAEGAGGASLLSKITGGGMGSLFGDMGAVGGMLLAPEVILPLIAGITAAYAGWAIFSREGETNAQTIANGTALMSSRWDAFARDVRTNTMSADDALTYVATMLKGAGKSTADVNLATGVLAELLKGGVVHNTPADLEMFAQLWGSGVRDMVTIQNAISAMDAAFAKDMPSIIGNFATMTATTGTMLSSLGIISGGLLNSVTLMGPMQQDFSNLNNAVTSAAAAAALLKGHLPSVPGGGGWGGANGVPGLPPLSGLPRPQATGGDTVPGGVSIVGEKGMELVKWPTGVVGQVIPHDESMALLNGVPGPRAFARGAPGAGAAGSIDNRKTITQLFNLQTSADPYEIAREVGWAVGRAG